MNVLIYATGTSETHLNLKQMVEDLAPDHNTETFASVEALKQRLHRPLTGETIGLFLPKDRRQLSGLMAVRSLLRDTKIILSVPDMAEATVTAGHSLRPRFLTHAGGDLSQITAVLRKMIRNIRQLETKAGNVDESKTKISRKAAKLANLTT